MPRMIDPTPWTSMKRFLEHQAMVAGRKHLDDLWPSTALTSDPMPLSPMVQKQQGVMSDEEQTTKSGQAATRRFVNWIRQGRQQPGGPGRSPFAGMGENLPPCFKEITLARLLILPANLDVPFEPFADRLIQVTGIKWTNRDTTYHRMLLRGAIQRMVIAVLTDFGVVGPKYQDKPRGKGTIRELVSFRIISLGKGIGHKLSKSASCQVLSWDEFSVMIGIWRKRNQSKRRLDFGKFELT